MEFNNILIKKTLRVNGEPKGLILAEFSGLGGVNQGERVPIIVNIICFLQADKFEDLREELRSNKPLFSWSLSPNWGSFYNGYRHLVKTEVFYDLEMIKLYVNQTAEDLEQIWKYNDMARKEVMKQITSKLYNVSLYNGIVKPDFELKEPRTEEEIAAFRQHIKDLNEDHGIFSEEEEEDTHAKDALEYTLTPKFPQGGPAVQPLDPKEFFITAEQMANLGKKVQECLSIDYAKDKETANIGDEAVLPKSVDESKYLTLINHLGLFFTPYVNIDEYLNIEGIISDLQMIISTTIQTTPFRNESNIMIFLEKALDNMRLISEHLAKELVEKR